MQIQDLFVGTIAAIVGSAIIAGAAVEWSWLMQRPVARFLIESLGRLRARVFIGFIGAALIAMGVVVALGWRVDWS